MFGPRGFTLARYNTCGYTSDMVLDLKLRKIGNSVGIVLPKEALAHLKLREGDSVSVTDSADGSLRLSPASADVKRQLDVIQDVIHRYRRTLRELAK